MESITIIETISLVVAFGMFCTTIYQLDKQNKITNIKNHIELKKMFGEQGRITIHSHLRPGGDWYNNGKGPESQEDWIMIEDYLGLFELCEEMLKDKTLKNDLFKKSYHYKLQNIAQNKIIMEKVNNPEENWELFKELLKRYNLSK